LSESQLRGAPVVLCGVDRATIPIGDLSQQVVHLGRLDVHRVPGEALQRVVKAELRLSIDSSIQRNPAE
jgi:hypothetical protein